MKKYYTIFDFKFKFVNSELTSRHDKFCYLEFHQLPFYVEVQSFPEYIMLNRRKLFWIVIFFFARAF